MRRTVLSLVALVVLFCAAEAVAQPPARPPGVQGLRPSSAAPATGPSTAPRRAAVRADLAPCDEVPGALCDRVAVPLDRDEPAGASLDIFYAVFPHTDAAAPAEGTIFVTFGGPGASATQLGGQGFVDYVFGPLRERRDVVLIDYRGTGLSQAIDCEELQQNPDDVYAAFRACGEQLGTTSDLYGSGDVARDLEAVRAALGVERFDFYGFSYAAADAQAYAARYPEHLGRVVLDSPLPLVGLDTWGTPVAKQLPVVVRRVCRRSASCRRDVRQPRVELRRLLERVRRAPVSGTAVDSLGEPHEVSVDEATLITILLQDLGGFTAQSEIAAAGRALRAGDDAPLLRLAAELLIPFPVDPPELFSVGLNAARWCSDQRFPWDPAAAPAERARQFEAATDALDPRRFAPFSVDGWVSPAPLSWWLPDPCIGWPTPTHVREAPVPDGASAPGVPALVLAAEYDLVLPPSVVTEVRRVFPDSRQIQIGSSGHIAVFGVGSECAIGLVQRFLATGDPGDASCAPAAPVTFPGVGRFPRAASGLRPARPVAGEDASTQADRRVAAAAAAAVTDAFRRLFIAGPTDHGQGLRGGAVEAGFADDDSGAFAQLDGASFTADVGVTGRATYDFATGAIDADVAVSAPAASGQVRVSGVWYAPGATVLRIDGELGGRRIVAEVPAT